MTEFNPKALEIAKEIEFWSKHLSSYSQEKPAFWYYFSKVKELIKEMPEIPRDMPEWINR